MPSEWDQLALEKLTNVLGDQEARAVFSRSLSAIKLESIQSVQDLYAFGQRVVMEEGFAGAVGALISTVAVMRGASPDGRGI